MTDMLSSIPAPSGNEEILKKFLKKLIKTETYEDSLGNLIVHKKSNGKKFMVICGIDEDSLVVLSQDKDKLYFNHIGDKNLFPGTGVSVGGNEGYIFSDNEDKPLESQYIKLTSGENIEIGAPGVVSSEYFDNDEYIKGNRIGKICVINEMINLANNYDGDYEVQSLFNHKGAIVASNDILPEYIIAFEEIEHSDDKVSLIKASKGHISSQFTQSFFENADLESFVDTKMQTTATFTKNSDIAVLGVPVKFLKCASSYIFKDTKEHISKIFNTIF